VQPAEMFSAMIFPVSNYFWGLIKKSFYLEIPSNLMTTNFA
jgi:hypothetical protein